MIAAYSHTAILPFWLFCTVAFLVIFSVKLLSISGTRLVAPALGTYGARALYGYAKSIAQNFRFHHSNTIGSNLLKAGIFNSNLKLASLIICLSTLSVFVNAQVSGTVFRDFNGNGTKDTYEPGIAGVTVKAYNAAGTQVGATATSAATTGAWSITTGTTATVRVEFQLPTSNSNPIGPLAGRDFSAMAGSAYGSSIQFVAGNATGVNFAIMDPNDYWDATEDHRYVTSCFVNGLTTGTGANDAAVVSMLYSSSGLNSAYQNYNGTQGTGPNPSMDAIISQVGSVWGEAYYKTQKHFYFGTFLKRHCGIADGSGYIYNFDYSGTTPSYTGKFNLQGATPINGGAAIDLGSVTRTGSSDYTLPSDKTLANVDLDAFAKVGAISFGDIDMQPGSGYLWAVNLYQKALIRIDVSDNPTSLPTDVSQYILSTLPGYPTSSTGTLRPWGLAFNAGKGYLGLVADASISQNDNDLLAYVLQFDPNNIAAGFTQVLSFSPNIKRGSLASNEKYHYWLNTYAEPPVTTNGAKRWHTQPILSDIEFDGYGNMILSFQDRFAHQVGYYNYSPVAGSTTLVRAFGYGDLLKACANGTGWDIEGTNSCHTGAELIQDQAGDGEVESSQGAIALLKGKNELMAISIDPHPNGTTGQAYWNTQGANTYNLTTGAISNWYSVYYSGGPPLYGKTNGLGDVEFVVDAAPIEIGNRVWNDTDKDGVQDAGESGIGNVTLELYPDFDNDGGPDNITGASNCETKSFSSAANNACAGSVAWSNPTNALTSNSTAATVALSSTNTTSNCLQVNNAGYNIPTNATINGVTVTIRRLGSLVNSVRDNTVQLMIGGSPSGSNLATTTSWPNSYGNAVYGGTTELWGLALTPAQVNATNFGVSIRARRTANSPTASVDYVEISVCYTTASGVFAIATTTTAASGAVGTYYFNNANVTDGDPTVVGNQTGLQADKTYLVRVASSDWTGGVGVSELAGMVLTYSNNGTGQNQPDEVDSDAALSSGLPQISVTTGAVGETNHSYDMGFITCPSVTNPSTTQTVCLGGAGTNITVNTTTNAASSIRFVRFSSDQSATNGSESGTELANIYAGTAIATVSPTGGASPYTATYVFNAADFPAAGTYYIYAILNPDPGAICRPVQEVIVHINNATAAITNSDQTICPNAQPTLNVSAAGSGTLAYQWQSSTSGCGGTFNDILGATLATYQLPEGLSVNTNYRVVVTSTLNGVACSATSNCVTITVTNIAATLTQTAATCAGDLPNNNGSINLTTVSNANKYGISLGTTYTGPTYSAATTIGGLPTVVQSSVPNSGGTYVIRFFNGSNDCYKDVTVNVSAVDCTSGSCTSGNLGGTAWTDLDADGTKDASETGLFSDIVVRVYDCNGNLVATDVTNSSGIWWVNDNGFSYPVRVEFSNIPSYAYATMDGANSKTSVQFVSAASCTVDLGLQVPADYCDTANPLIGLSCFEPGNAMYGGTGNVNKGIIAFPYNSSGATPCCMTDVAKIYQVGTVWGMGYQARHKRMFTSATLMRHMGLGPQGLGGVYVMDFMGGLDTLISSFSLQGISPANGGAAIDLGSINRTGTDYQLPNNNTTSSWDIDAFDKIGKVGFGDADVSQDGNTLWLVNLNQRALVTVDITSTASYPGTVNQYLLSNATGLPTCTNGVLRPWGLAFENGKGYLGCMCTGESGGTDANLQAYVLSFDPANPTVFTTEANFSLNYTREKAVDFPGYGLDYQSTWHRWASTWAQTGFTNSPISEVVYAQPILSDIDFLTDGSMVVGLTDRFGFQLGYTNYIPVSGVTVETGADGAGDILKLCKSGGTWVMEGGTGCAENDNTTHSALGNDGPGGTGEFFYGDGFDDTAQSPTYNHSETFLGSLGVMKGFNEVTATHYDPSNGANFAFDLGLLWHNTTTGARADEFRIVASGPASTKGNGLGDFEFVCAAAPKQIGNYVWIDTDKDGVQDPCESGVNGIKVSLYKLVGGAATLVTSTTTATVNGLQGAYYFKDYQQYGSGFDTLLDNTLYYVVLGETGGTSTWSTASQRITIGGAEYTLTSQNTGQGATPDLNDSDAFVFTTSGKPYTNYPVDTVTIGYAGYINHSLDFGLKLCPTITNPSAAQAVCIGETGANITVNTTTNAANSIRFVRFATDQMAGSVPTPAEAAAIYTGTNISTVTPTGASAPYTATYVFNAADFPTATTYYVYAILNPDEGAACRPTQEIVVNINQSPSFTLGLVTVCPGESPEVNIDGLTNGNPATSTMKINTGAFVPYVASPPNLTTSNGIILSTTNTVTVRNENGCEATENIAVPGVVPLACPPVTLTKLPTGID